MKVKMLTEMDEYRLNSLKTHNIYFKDEMLGYAKRLHSYSFITQEAFEILNNKITTFCDEFDREINEELTP